MPDQVYFIISVLRLPCSNIQVDIVNNISFPGGMQSFKIADNVLGYVIFVKQRHYLLPAEGFCVFIDFYTIDQKCCFFTFDHIFHEKAIYYKSFQHFAIFILC